MGGLFQRDPIDDPLAYLMAKYNYDCATHTLQTLEGARAGNTVYVAVRSTDKNTGRSYVFAAVSLIRNSKKDGFGYKDQDEGMGPHQYDCPQRIMRLLSPIADLAAEGFDLSRYLVIYRDTRGIWDQLLVDGSGRFAGFSSVNERDLSAALAKVTRH